MTIAFLLAAALLASPEAELQAKLPEIFAKSAAHYKALDAAATPLMKDAKGELRTPHGFDRAKKSLDMRSIYWWTSGHFPGSLWYLYEATGDVAFRDRALAWTEILAPVSKYEGNHDVGFMMYCSYGNARRLLKTRKYDALLAETAATLCKRYNADLGLIRSWGKTDETKNFLVIPDNLMNLELLEWAAKAGKGGDGTPDFAAVAESHADVTMRHHFRPDGSCYHVLDYDQRTKRVKGIECGQGASCETAWSRGQSWGIYGYAMMYRMTGFVRYLDFACKLADYAMNHPDMPADGIPYWDYGAPGEERDSSAGAIMASALIELSQFVDAANGARYRQFAVRQLLSLASSAYFSEGDEIGHFLLKHGTGHKPANSEIDTPLDYGDYYFLEALLRFRDLTAREAVQKSASAVDYVDPFVGTAGTGHTTPAACVPFGLIQAGADTGFGDWPHCGGYIYGDKTICGFTQTHVNGTGCPDLGDLRLLPFRGERPQNVPFDHADETATPGYYAVDLRDVAVKVEVTVSEHAAIYRLTPTRDGALKLLVDDKALFFNPPEFPKQPEERLFRELVRDASGKVCGVRGSYRAKCWVKRVVSYDVAFSREGKDIGSDSFSFDLKAGQTLLVKLALSAEGGVSAARANLASEMPGWEFDGVRAQAVKKWNDVLACASIEGTVDQKKNFYTSLYHLFVQPSNIADVGQQPFYSTFSCWDTFRAAGPLYTVLCPDRAADFVGSLIEQGRRTGFLPIWTLWGQDNQCMIATHSIPMIVDWFLKGGKGPDWEAVYAQVKDTLTKRHDGRKKENWDLYDTYGYYPFDKIRGESVSRTLECAYDDWCAGVMAGKLGHAEDAAFFFKRASFWKNVFDPSIGFVRGKDSSGRWREPYDPYALGHGADLGNDFTEGNAFQYSWHVMQDVPGLIEAMGGRDEFLKKLDGLFTASEKVTGEGLTLDVTGLIGQYVHGNEPSHHVLYFYPQVGQPEKAAVRIREVFDKFYLPKPDGLCGNDDCGQMSAWYVFSAMGFYPFNPCGGEYVLGAPQVPKATIRNAFTVIANNLSRENKYVKSVTLNGKPVTDWKIRHADILKGGELVFEMGK